MAVREQPTEDYGIDAQLEVVDGEDVRGRLLALHDLAWRGLDTYELRADRNWHQAGAGDVIPRHCLRRDVNLRPTRPAHLSAETPLSP